MSAIRTRLAIAGLSGAAWLLARLPDRALHRAAMVIGAGCYAVMSERRARARDNLGRACRYLADRGLGGPRIAAVAHDAGALDRLARAAFGHWLRSYLEVLLAPRYTAAYLRERLTFDDPAAVAGVMDRVRNGRRTIFVAPHFGCMEVPALYAGVEVGVPAVAPMETLANAAINEWLTDRRGTGTIRIVPLAGAARALRRALADREIVALVADRDLTGNGRLTPFFGAPARLPIGPAVLAEEAGADVYAVGVRRTGPGTYRGRLIALSPSTGGSLRARVDAFLADEVAAFESIVADAPEQWWTVMFPIWEADARTAGASPIAEPALR